MSIPRRMTVNCSKCGHPLTVTVFESINSDYAKDVAIEIMSGELFEARCPRCQFVSHLEYDFLYHDIKNSAMIWVLHKDSPNYTSKISEIRTAQKLPHKTLRIVEDMNALKEKVSCLERNRDDRIIEMCKIFILGNLLAQKPNFAFKEAFYSVLSGEELIYFYDVSGESLICKLQDETYDYLSRLYFNSRYADEFDPNYAIVDCDWADEVVAPLLQAEVDRIQAGAAAKIFTTNHSEETGGTVCPECKNSIPQDSEYCQYCGCKVNKITVTDHPKHQKVCTNQNESPAIPRVNTTYEKKAKTLPFNKKKWWIVLAVALVVVALLCYGISVGQNYSRFEDSLDNQEFIKASRYFDAIPFGSKILSEEYEYMNAGILMEEGKYIEAYSAFTSNQSRPIPESILSGLKDKLYSFGQVAYRSAKYSEAREYFNIISEYKRSGDYLLLLDCSDAAAANISAAKYKSLLKLLDTKFENADKIILETDRLLERFLTARWEDGQNHSYWVEDDEESEYWWESGHTEYFGPYYFEIDKDSTAQSNLPHKSVEGFYEISDGHYLVGEGSSMTKIFRFTIIDQNTISVYCYKDGSTHTLYRK